MDQLLEASSPRADQDLTHVRLPQPNISLFKQIASTETIVSVLPCSPQKNNADLEKYNRVDALVVTVGDCICEKSAGLERC